MDPMYVHRLLRSCIRKGPSCLRGARSHICEHGHRSPSGQCGFEIPIAANVAGTIANNIGAPLLYLLWEQYFASEDDDQCIADILVGRGLPVLLFALLGLISSSSQTMGLRAVILLVAAVTLTRCYRSMDWSAPMYAERPLDHRRHLSQCHGLVLEKRFMHRLTCLPVHGFKIGVYK